MAERHHRAAFGPMKIGILTGSVSRNAGGTFEAIRNMAQEMCRLPDVDVSVFGLRDEGLEKDLDSWRPVPLKAFSTQGPRSFGYAGGLYPALRDASIDLLHVHGLWMYPSVAAQMWQLHSRRPRLVSPHGMLDSWALANAGWKKRVAASLYENRHLRRGACIHALCREEARAIREFGLSNPICVVPNGVAPAPAQRPGLPAWRQALGPSCNVLLYFGRLHPKKGLVPLLHGWAATWKAGGSAGHAWRLVIGGWNQENHEQELRKLAAELGVADSIKFIGPQFGQDKEATFAAADAFILPSLSEGLPMVVLEAWARRLAVLMTPACNLDEGFSAGAAMPIEPQAASIGEGLLRLFALPVDGRQTMGVAGHRLVAERFSRERTASEMLAVYSWLLGKAACPDSVELATAA